MNANEIRQGLTDILDDASNCSMIGSATRYIESAISLLYAQRWIPVGERMPDSRVNLLMHVLGSDGDWNICEGWYWGDRPDDWAYADARSIPEGCVTHWRPLPPPPEKGEG